MTLTEIRDRLQAELDHCIDTAKANRNDGAPDVAAAYDAGVCDGLKRAIELIDTAG